MDDSRHSEKWPNLRWMAAGVFTLAALLAALMEPATHAQLPETSPANERDAFAASGGKPAANLLYGRVILDKAVFEGRLRWGGDQEALWSHYFNATKRGNPWGDFVPNELRARERESIDVLGISIFRWTRLVSINRPFLARFGDIARIELRGKDIHVTLKSGASAHIHRNGADDMNDGVRVWDESRGLVNLAEWGIHTIEFLASVSPATTSPLYGTVRTRVGDFTGLIQWNRTQCLPSDELVGQSAGNELRVRFAAIRSIARHSADSSLVTLVDGRSVLLSGSREVGPGNGGIYVDDQRYGRVLVSWDAFDRVDFRAGGSGLSYADFPVGRPLTGTVVTRSGRRLVGRLVYDLDESQTTETLDAPSQGIDYLLPFSLIASISVSGTDARDGRSRVVLRSGEELRLEQEGDLGPRHAGMLIFIDGRQQPEYVPWADIQRVDFDR